VQKQIAEWNTELKLWIKPNEGLFSERLELFSATWPISGMTQNGQALELVMPERHISDSESLSLPTPRAKEPGSTSVGYEDSLNDFANRVVNGYARKDIELFRSPTASQGEGGALGEAVARERGNTVGIRDQAMDIARLQGHKVSREIANLPTPTVSDQYTGNLSSKQHSEGSLHSVSLAQIVNRPDLLPTPNTMEHREIKTPEQIAALKAKSPGGYKNLRESVVNELFPTPKALDGVKGNLKTSQERLDSGHQVDLPNIAIDLLGTPRTSSANGSTPKQVDAGAPKSRIEDQVLTTNWGKFDSAIRRWEAIIGRSAPQPTKPDGKEGNHRLSSKFTEWMMGLPDGWITNIGLKRNDELKACGNGVVPQQAELALSLLGIKEILERN
jgi:hypothetical protein